MKNKLIFPFFILAFSLFVADSLPDLDWKTVNGKMANWSGNVQPLSSGGIQLKGKNCISYSKRKYRVGESRKARVVFSMRGYASSIGIYCYGKKGTFAGQFQERIPNAEDTRKFEAVFEIPQKMKGKEVGSFRVFFTSSENLEILNVEIYLEN